MPHINRQHFVDLAREVLSEEAFENALSAAALSVQIASLRAETLSKLRDAPADCPENAELQLMYSVLIPGFSNQEAVNIIELSAVLYPIVKSKLLTNTQIKDRLFDHVSFFDLDTAILIAYYACCKIEEASIYMECCAVIHDVYESTQYLQESKKILQVGEYVVVSEKISSEDVIADTIDETKEIPSEDSSDVEKISTENLHITS